MENGKPIADDSGRQTDLEDRRRAAGLESEARLAEARTAGTPLLLSLVGLLVISAGLNRFIQDDAFISFQYARNLVEGNGLTFNPGEWVEGYTNFLWTLLMAAGIGAGAEPVVWSYLLGLAFFAGSLLATYHLAAGLSEPAAAGLVAMGLLGTNFSFNAYATGGLETQMQAFLVVAAIGLSWRATRGPGPSSPGLLAAASCAYGLAVLTRLDSAVLLLLPGLLVLARVLWGDGDSGFDGRGPGAAHADDAAITAKQGGAAITAKQGDAAITAKQGDVAAAASGSSAATAARVAAFCVPALLLIVPWLAWKISYYGDLLPNTFYVKVTSAASLARGGHYVYRFFATYWLLPLAVLALVARPRRVAAALRRGGPWGTVLPATVLLWCAYVAFVGGDFMEFRFMVPALPLVMALLSWCLFAVVDNRRARAAVVAVVILGSAFHAATFWGVRDIESIRSLAIHMEPDGGDWDEVGRTLGEHFGPEDGVLIAVGPAGAIPYYSRLPSVDMRGLVDPWVARHGIIVSTVPGHQRMAPLAYLVDRGVNLVVGHPQVIARQRGLPAAYTLSSLGQLGLADASPATVPLGARILGIPMPGDRLLLVLYLVRDLAVDRAIAEKGWPTVPLVDSVEPLG
ncbi:MAG TPA: hypothetical protein VGD06_03620 [Acidobacteriota bacterium]